MRRSYLELPRIQLRIIFGFRRCVGEIRCRIADYLFFKSSHDRSVYIVIKEPRNLVVLSLLEGAAWKYKTGRAWKKLPAGFKKTSREKTLAFMRFLPHGQNTHPEFVGSIQACHGLVPHGLTLQTKQEQCRAALRRRSSAQ